MEKPASPTLPDDGSSLSEQMSAVFRQPAFIASLGSACWMVLMGFSAWIYCRHRRRKELGHYATSFAYTPAGEGTRKRKSYEDHLTSYSLSYIEKNDI